MKKILLISLVLTLFSAMLLAQMPARANKNCNDGMQIGRSNPMANCMEELKLTDAQMQKVAEARTGFERQQNTISAEIENLRLDIVTAFKAENIKRVKELNQQLSAKQLQLKNARVDMMAAVLKELNKEQKEMMKNHMPMMMMGGGHQAGRQNMQNCNRGRKGSGQGEARRDCDEQDGDYKHKRRK